MPKKSKAAFLEANEPYPDDLDSWLEEWGFDLKYPIQQQRDSDGFIWFFQNEGGDEKSD